MTAPHEPAEPVRHSLVTMAGRRPDEPHRAATPLELLYDLTFVIGFGSAANQLAHSISEGHALTGIIAFGFVMFAICWAWINYSWFSSAYDTDDWAYRLVTFVQMIGVIVLSLGIPRAVQSIDNGTRLDNGIIVLGYVIMRLGMVSLWLRAAIEDPSRRKTCLAYAISILIAQVGWVALLFVSPGAWTTAICWVVLLLLELSGPVVSELWVGEGGTPWHAHHIAERYSLLAIIGLGESIIGTVATVSAIVEHQGWSGEAVMMCAAGVGLTFGLWWIYFMLPSAQVLHHHRNRAFPWGYLHIPLFACIAATGAGLHVVGLFIEHKSKVGATATMISAALPVGLFIAGVYLLYYILLRTFDAVHRWLLGSTLAVLLASIALAAAGASLTVCLAVLTIAPLITIIGYETVGVGHQRDALKRVFGGGRADQ